MDMTYGNREIVGIITGDKTPETKEKNQGKINLMDQFEVWIFCGLYDRAYARRILTHHWAGDQC